MFGSAWHPSCPLPPLSHLQELPGEAEGTPGAAVWLQSRFSAAGRGAYQVSQPPPPPPPLTPAPQNTPKRGGEGGSGGAAATALHRRPPSPAERGRRAGGARAPPAGGGGRCRRRGGGGGGRSVRECNFPPLQYCMPSLTTSICCFSRCLFVFWKSLRCGKKRRWPCL